MKSVLLSIKPKYCKLIASGKKTVEIRKNRPKIDVPFKCYIYQSKGNWIYKILEWLGLYQQKVIGEFVCDRIDKYEAEFTEDDSCYQDIRLIWKDEDYAWHISDLVIYDKPKELSEFYRKCDNGCGNDCEHWKYIRVNKDEFDMDCDCGGMLPITRPPQSWCYVEELEG